MRVERANMLTLTVPEMTVLLGGMRALNTNAGQTVLGVLTDRPGTLSNDFFVNLLGMATKWSKSTTSERVYDGLDRSTGKPRWTATPVDLVFGSNQELRTVAEFYATADSQGEVRRRLDEGVDQGDEPRPVRSAQLTLARSDAQPAIGLPFATRQIFQTCSP